MKLLITLCLSATFLSSAARTTSACLCPVLSVSQKKKDAEAVFVGTVKEREREVKDYKIYYRVKFAVERSWKNAEMSEMVIYTGDGCSVWFEPGKKYLVYAHIEKERARLETNMCSGTGLVDLSAKDLKRLGKGKAVVASKNGTTK